MKTITRSQADFHNCDGEVAGRHCTLCFNIAKGNIKVVNTERAKNLLDYAGRNYEGHLFSQFEN